MDNGNAQHVEEVGLGERPQNDRIAIVGVGCRFPGADNAEQYWRNLRDGVESVSFFSAEQLRAVGVPDTLLARPDYVCAAAVLVGAEEFDAKFFGINPREAGMMDPQHRLLLECAWESLEDSGQNPIAAHGPVGIFAGAYRNDHADTVETEGDPAVMFARNIATEADYLATRVSYKLNLTGPSVTVQTACSTSLVAVHLACQSLLAGDCRLALAGGVAVRAGQYPGHVFQPGGILSADGHCRAFDANADGTVLGEGVGLVVLKRLAEAVADGDTVRAVILGSAIGNDGSSRVGFTAPGVDGQSRLVEAAHVAAQVHPDTIGYIETHGSGTPIGDRIEVEALSRVFRSGGWTGGSCAIGSVKTNIGHTHTAAGIAGLIKSVLTVQHGLIPPSLHFARPNEMIDFERSPFHVNTKLTPWPPGNVPRRAAVSSFGLGGAGAHVVLEQAPQAQSTEEDVEQRCQVLVVSTRTESALEVATDRLAKHLAAQPNQRLADIAHTLQTGRSPFRHRRTVVADNHASAAAALRFRDPNTVRTATVGPNEPRIAFMFPGLGEQHPDMGRELYTTQPVFRRELDCCAEILRARSDVDLRAVLYSDLDPDEAGLSTEAAAPEHGRSSNDGLDLRAIMKRDRRASPPPMDTAQAQPAMFAVEYALARLWMEWGIRPDAMIGYSIGEYVAACLAGVLAVEDALFLVAARAQMIAELPCGAMLAVPLSERRLREVLNADLAISAVNGPELCVVSGTEDAVSNMEDRLRADSVASRRLQVSHAFHSPLMEPVTDKLTELVAGIELREPTIPYLSNVTGDWITPDETTDPAYWARHMRQAVRFADSVEQLWQTEGRLLLEVGPGAALGSLALPLRMQRGEASTLTLSSLPQYYNRRAETAVLLDAVAKLWLAGAPIDWAGHHNGQKLRRIPLPTYPFERRRQPVGPPQTCSTRRVQQRPQSGRRPDLADWFSVPVWEPLPPLPPPTSGGREGWLLFIDDWGIGARLAESLRADGHRVTTVRARAGERQLDGQELTIDPGRALDYAALLHDIPCGDFPRRIVHLWSVSPPGGAGDVENDLLCGFQSMLLLAKAVGGRALSERLEVSVVSSDMQAVAGAGAARPARATVLGPCRVWPQEDPRIACRSIDITIPKAGSWRETQTVQALRAELSQPIDDATLAHRGNLRWRQAHIPMRVAKQDWPTRLRPGGTYLITGGLGGIGLTLARHLVGTYRANLVLVSRTVRQTAEVQALEAAGGSVLALAADVTNVDQMRSVLAKARSAFGAVHGIIHAAGIPGGGLIQLKDPVTAQRVLAPKVHGALVLRKVCASDDLDFVLYCSSVLAVTGALGQVDYCAANSFLDALAQQEDTTGGTFTVSVNWDGWRGLGMAVRAGLVHAQGGAQGSSTGHPLLHCRIEDTRDRSVFASDFRIADTWLVDEHRILGYAVVPGTGHIELARAAFAQREGGGPVELRDLTFFTPIVVRPDETKQVRTILRRDGGGYEFRVISRGGDNRPQRWQVHSVGHIRRADAESRPRLDIPLLITHAELRDVGRPMYTGPMGFGPRSNCLERMYVGNGEYLAMLALPERFTDELGSLALHPSLMDIAAAFVGLHVGEEFRMPIRYGELRMAAPLTRRIYSYQRYRTANRAGAETTSADITITDEDGQELVRVKDFVLKRAGDLEGRLRTVADGTSTEIAWQDDISIRASSPDGIAFLRQQTEYGIHASEGVEAFERILAAGLAPQVVVTPQDLAAITAQVEAAPAQQRSTPAGCGSHHPRPNMLTPYVEPGSATERELSAIWQDLLGIQEVGRDDNFFELGGHSLLGIQLTVRLRESFGVDLPLGVLFESLTVAKLATALDTAYR